MKSSLQPPQFGAIDGRAEHLREAVSASGKDEAVLLRTGAAAIGRKPATLRDIAAATGVAISAVSSVVNGSRTGSRVSERTRALILETAKAMRYHPNAIARGLGRRSTGNIGVVLGAPTQLIHQPYVASFLEGIVEGAGDVGYQPVIFTTSWSEADGSVGAFCDGRVDGLIVYSPPDDSAVIAGIQECGVPVVGFDLWAERANCVSVGCDERAAMRLCIDHLMSLGHRSFAYVSAPSGTCHSTFRAATAVGVMAEMGVERARNYELPECSGEAESRERLRALLRLLDRPTAIVTASHKLALLAIDVAGEVGMSVPTDLSVVAIDDFPDAVFCTPALTAVRRPVRSMARSAVRLLYGQITQNCAALDGHADTVDAPGSIMFSADLVVRSSTARPPD